MNRTRTAALAAASLALLLAGPGAGAATSTADAPWSGYRTTTTAYAGGGWIGARSVADQVVYRIDPARTRTTTTGFGAAAWQSELTGSGPRAVTSVDVARAAWILGKYGSYRYAVQNAAVEVALDHLLHGGAWSLSGATTRQRLAQSGQGPAISSFATQMLDDSARLAGPYQVTVATSGATAVGGSVTVTTKVVATRTRLPVPNLPVSVTYAGATPATATTATDGSAAVTVPAGEPGSHTVTVRVDRIPETRVLARAPAQTGASRVVVAGQKASRTLSTSVAVQAAPALSVAPTGTTYRQGAYIHGRVTTSGLPAGYSQKASLRLYGPFPAAGDVGCDPSRLRATQAVPVAGNGTVNGPDLAVTQRGYYVWVADLPAGPYSPARSTSCSAQGAVFQVIW